MSLHIKKEDRLEFHLDRINFNLSRTLPTVIYLSTYLIVSTLIVLFLPAVLAMIGVIFILLLMLQTIRMYKKRQKEFIDEHYQIRIINRRLR